MLYSYRFPAYPMVHSCEKYDHEKVYDFCDMCDFVTCHISTFPICGIYVYQKVIIIYNILYIIIKFYSL
jgi:hypothetical protein